MKERFLLKKQKQWHSKPLLFYTSVISSKTKLLSTISCAEILNDARRALLQLLTDIKCSIALFIQIQFIPFTIDHSKILPKNRFLHDNTDSFYIKREFVVSFFLTRLFFIIDNL